MTDNASGAVGPPADLAYIEDAIADITITSWDEDAALSRVEAAVQAGHRNPPRL
jgi:hypothetical protein